MKNLHHLFICIAFLFTVGLACSSPSSDRTRPSTDRGDTLPTGSASARRGVASQLKSEFAGYDEVSIYTKGDNDEVLYIGFAGMSDSDKSRADQVVSRFKSKIKGYGFKRIEFSNGRKTIANYDLNE